MLADGPPLEPLTVEDEFGHPLFTVPDRRSRPASKAARATLEPTATPASGTRCPAGMVYIAGGSFSNRPISAFCLDALEVTVGSFAGHMAAVEKRGEMTKKALAELRRLLQTIDWPVADVAETRARSPFCTLPQAAKDPGLPINCVSYSEAEAYCMARGKRLPSEREWRWAARGRRAAWTYPWGKKGVAREYANMADGIGEPRLARVGTLKPSSGGLHDLAGNVWEWVAGDVDAGEFAARGGGFRSQSLQELKVTAERRVSTRNARSDEVGFRCAAPVAIKDKQP